MTDPRITALAEALADAMAADDHWPMFSVTRDIKPLAAAILAALRAEGWDIVGRDTVIEDDDER